MSEPSLSWHPDATTLPLAANGPGPAASFEPLCPHSAAGRLPAPRRRIISASKRTDIPAFYLRWMLERVQAGWVDVPNPLFRHALDPLRRLSHVSLLPEHVLALVWWSKNYAVYERLHHAFAAYRVQHFHVTINPRRPDLAWLEPDVPPLEEMLRQVRFLAGLPGGPQQVTWRYDPLVFWFQEGEPRSSWDADYFERVCRKVAAVGVTRCVTSLADRYARFEQRVRRNFRFITLRDPAPDEIDRLAREMVAIARAHGVRIESCAEPALESYSGISRAACIDGRSFNGPARAATDQKMRGREACGCTLHTDIGDYLTQVCGYACVYCYAHPRPLSAPERSVHAKGKSQKNQQAAAPRSD